MSKIFKIFTWIILAAVLTCSAAMAAARISGKILSVNTAKRLYVVELKDGSKINIQLREDGKLLRSYGSEPFKIGESVVFSIVSPLNDNPMIADGVMDAAYAKTTYTTAYTMPKNTPVGGMATIAGPVITGGTRPNVIGGIAHGGSPGSDPGNVVNAPFTASPSALSTPVTGQVITAPNGQISAPQGGLFDGGSDQTSFFPNQKDLTQSPLSPLNPQGPSGFTNQQPAQTQQQPLNLATGGPGAANANPNAMITGSSNQNNPSTMIYGDGAFGKNGGNAAGDPSMLFGNNEEDDDEEDDPFSNVASKPGAAGSPVQITAKLMSIDAKNGVIFYMMPGAPGMQDLGSAVLTNQTQIIDGRTKQAIPFQNLANGSTLNIEGIRRDASSITARTIVIMP